MSKTIYQILMERLDDLEDDQLSCLSDINMLQNLTPEESGAAPEKLKSECEQLVQLIDGLTISRNQIKNWIVKIENEQEAQYKQEIFNALPWVKEKYEKWNR